MKIGTSSRVSLIKDLLRAGRTVRVRAFGSSMAPAIESGDTLVISPTMTADIGEIVVCIRRTELVAHRVVSVAPLTTRGDALSSADTEVEPEELLGRVTQVERSALSSIRRGLRKVCRVFW